MAIEWTVVAEIVKPLAGGLIGLAFKSWSERRPKLISWFGSVSTHQVAPPDQPPFRVFTHEVVLRNVGKKPARGVRMQHHVLPDFHVFPPIQYTQEHNPAGANDIVFPTLLPGEQVTVSYLYFPPLKAGEVHAGIKFEEGFAQSVPVQLQRQLPRWANLLAVGLQVVGLVACFYLLWQGAVWLASRAA